MSTPSQRQQVGRLKPAQLAPFEELTKPPEPMAALEPGRAPEEPTEEGRTVDCRSGRNRRPVKSRRSPSFNYARIPAKNGYQDDWPD
jgi:hypothetical protein